MTDLAGVVLARDDDKPLPTGVPILDHGVTLTRDGYSVAVLDAGHAGVTLADTVESVLRKMFGPRSERQQREEER